MGKYLVVGRAGASKTAVSAELNTRGYTAFDSDAVDGLSSWVEYTTGEKVKLTNNTYVDREKYGWFWDTDIMENLTQTYTDMFLCGGAVNDLEFIDQFDLTFVLRVSPAVQIERLKNRTNNDYGQDSRMHDFILKETASHLANAVTLGAIVINADKSISDVITEIESHIHDHS